LQRKINCKKTNLSYFLFLHLVYLFSIKSHKQNFEPNENDIKAIFMLVNAEKLD